MDLNDDKSQRKQCFSLIHSCSSLPSSAVKFDFCPSMDLIAVYNGNGTAGAAHSSSGSGSGSGSGSSSRAGPLGSSMTTMAVHRTVSWQKVATCSSLSGEDYQTVCWSPNGRVLALGLRTGTIILFDVERGMTSSSSISSSSSSSSASSDLQPQGVDGRIYEVNLLEREGIATLKWFHVGKLHPAWKLTSVEQEREATWSYQKRYLDRSSTFLPPSSHHLIGSHNDGSDGLIKSSVSLLPKATTPLSVLCAASAETTHQLYLFLHGRYHVATLKTNILLGAGPATTSTSTAASTIPVDMTCTSELSHVLLQHSNNRLSLFSLPALTTHRYSFQVVAALHSSIQFHLKTMEQHMTDVLASWKNSLRPLEAKLEALAVTLERYGVIDHSPGDDDREDLREPLLQYIVLGHSSKAANALEQFFSGVQMNDQLIVRMAKSLHSGLASVESLARKGLLGPSRSLFFDVQELVGIDVLIDTDASASLLRSAQNLSKTVESLVARHMVEARCRLQDLIAWLRSAGSATKAKGTAQNSAQRENAKKRRITDAQLERIICYFSQQQPQGQKRHHPRDADANMTETTKSPQQHHGTLMIEKLLGLPISAFFSNELNASASAPLSSRSVFSHDNSSDHRFESTPKTIPATYREVKECAGLLFDQPRTFLDSTIKRQDLLLPGTPDSSVCAIHTRIGCELDSPEEKDDNELGCFRPKTDKDFSKSRHWAVIAMSRDVDKTAQSIHILALPLGNSNSLNDNLFQHGDSVVLDAPKSIPYYLLSRLILPSEYRLQEIGFYGDDGRSSLFSGEDSGTGLEGRQAMVLLVEDISADKKAEHGSSQDHTELWKVDYDHLEFQVVDLSQGRSGTRSNSVVLFDSPVNDECSRLLEPLDNGSDDTVDGQTCWIKGRRIRTNKSVREISQRRLLVCGSRGVGGVRTSSTTFDIFDLEEEEDDDEEEDDISVDDE